jgi:ribosomal protein S18 acetylase RimI-like enzyme
MISSIYLSSVQLAESIWHFGITHTINQLIYKNRKIYVFEKNLNDLKTKNIKQKQLDYKIVAINSKNYRDYNFTYPLKSRYLKIKKRVNQGYENFSAVKSGVSMGDTWFAPCLDPDTTQLHPDVKLIEVHLKAKDIYLFDMYIDAKARGSNLANQILLYALHYYKKRGFSKIYSYVLAKNVPALWMVRTLNFKQIKQISLNRFIFFQNSKIMSE